MITNDTLASMSDEERSILAEIYDDPVTFARVVLNETPRWYQEKMIRDTSPRKVYRTGRRAGKCIHKDTRVYNPVTGEYKTAEDIFRYQSSIKERKVFTVLSIDDEDKLQPKEAMLFDNGIQHCYMIRTESGKEIILTGNHPLLRKSSEGSAWIEVDSIKPGMEIGVPGLLLNESTYEMNIDEIRFLALILADGHCKYQDIRFQGSKTIRDALSKSLKALNFDHESKDDMVKISYDARELLEKHNIMWAPKSEVRLPSEIYRLSQEQIKEFLRYFFSCQGTYTPNGLLKTKTKKIKSREVIHYSFSHSLLKDVQHLLLRFGIPSSLKQTALQGKEIYYVSIQGENSVGLFAKEIGSLNKNPVLDKKKDKDYKAESLLWETVTEKTYVGKQQTYDIAVPDYHNLVADDIFIHNTWSMVVEALHFIIANPGKRVLVAAPYDSQVELIFEEARKFIKKSALLSSMVTRDVRSPHKRIELSNGSVMMGFSSGTKSGSSGDSMRGLDADFIILDEVDRMNQNDIDSIMAIRYTDAKNRYVRAASTPTGRRSFFYEWCTDTTKGWSQHHYPSTVNPNWNYVNPETGKTLEEELREELSEQGWTFEVLAEFGVETAGVFNKDDIDRARKKYDYYDIEKPDTIPKNKLRILGVDWDKQTMFLIVVPTG